MLFVKKSEKKGLRQYWAVVGIIRAEDWNEGYEEDGRCRSWYDTKLTELVIYDWVEEYRVRKEISEKEEELDDVKDKEWEQERKCEHDRRFNKQGVKKSQNELALIVDKRKELESELKLCRTRLKVFAGPFGNY
jgi:hypothetical protein